MIYGLCLQDALCFTSLYRERASDIEEVAAPFIQGEVRHLDRMDKGINDDQYNIIFYRAWHYLTSMFSVFYSLVAMYLSNTSGNSLSQALSLFVLCMPSLCSDRIHSLTSDG